MLANKKSVSLGNYILSSQLCVATLAMAKAGTVTFEGKNKAGRNLIGAAGAGGDHDVKFKGESEAGLDFAGILGSYSPHESGSGPKTADSTDETPDLKAILGSGGIAGVAIAAVVAVVGACGLAITCCEKRVHIKACFGCNEKKRPEPAQNNPNEAPAAGGERPETNVNSNETHV